MSLIIWSPNFRIIKSIENTNYLNHLKICDFKHRKLGNPVSSYYMMNNFWSHYPYKFLLCFNFVSKQRISLKCKVSI